jgi:FkbM family methyltransferase
MNMEKTTKLPWLNTSVIGKASLPWLVKTSVLLDYKFCVRNRWSVTTKGEFLAKKYASILLHAAKLRRFTLGQSAMTLRGKRIYYESPLGLADYQSILTRHELLVSQCHIKDTGTVVDLGANVGYFTLLAAEKFPRARVIAFEPVQRVFRCLSENTKDRGNVEICRMAISNYEGRAFMHVDENDSQISQLTDEPTDEAVTVSTLDTVLAEKGVTDVDLLKIDVENCEKYVLQQAAATLARTRYLLIEISMAGNDNYTFSELVSLLHTDQYSFQLLALRNFSDVAEGVIPVGDFLFENVLYGRGAAERTTRVLATSAR